MLTGEMWALYRPLMNCYNQDNQDIKYNNIKNCGPDTQESQFCNFLIKSDCGGLQNNY